MRELCALSVFPLQLYMYGGGFSARVACECIVCVRIPCKSTGSIFSRLYVSIFEASACVDVPCVRVRVGGGVRGVWFACVCV